MRIFFLDLASHQGCIACVTEKDVAAMEQIDHRIGDSELMPRFQAALDRAGWKDRDLTGIACIVGPGGFTSLRVAVSMANALAHTLEIPLTGIHLSDLYKARAPEADLWLHSTKAEQLFIREFPDGEPQLITNDALLRSIPNPDPPSWTGELLETHRALMEGKKLRPSPLKPLEDILPSFLSSIAYKKGSLQPWYGREG